MHRDPRVDDCGMETGANIASSRPWLKLTGGIKLHALVLSFVTVARRPCSHPAVDRHIKLQVWLAILEAGSGLKRDSGDRSFPNDNLTTNPISDI